jgi:hypothetical protein
MDWLNGVANGLFNWFDRPASNGTVLIAVLFMITALNQNRKHLDGRLGYLGSVLEAIANHKPWPW